MIASFFLSSSLLGKSDLNKGDLEKIAYLRGHLSLLKPYSAGERKGIMSHRQMQVELI